MVLPARKVIVVVRVSLVSPARSDLLVLLVLLVRPARRGTRDRKVIRGFKVFKGRSVRKV